jgi:hypothetical protein
MMGAMVAERAAAGGAAAHRRDFEFAELGMQFTWRRCGALGLGATGELRLPPLPAGPAVFRLRVREDDGLDATFVGDTADLATRMAMLAAGQGCDGPAARALWRALQHGGSAELEVVTGGVFTGPMRPRAVDLADCADRRLLASAAALLAAH